MTKPATSEAGRVDGWENWEIEKTPIPALAFLQRTLPVDRFELRFKLDRSHGDPTL